jgi:hypothetical protein
MATNITPTLKRVLRELQALRARLDQQIKVVQGVIRSSAAGKTGTQRTTKKARPSALVGYSRDRQAFLKRKRLRKRR